MSINTYSLNLSVQGGGLSKQVSLTLKQDSNVEEVADMISRLFLFDMPGDKKAIEVFFHHPFTKVNFFSKTTNTSYKIEVVKGAQTISPKAFSPSSEMLSINSDSSIKYQTGKSNSDIYHEGTQYFPSHGLDRDLLSKDLVCKALFASGSISEISAVTPWDATFARRVSNLK